MKKSLLSLLLICSVSLAAFADLRQGALPGEFYVSPTKKVHFSSGNFQSCRNGNRLAEHQYDFIGASNRKSLPVGVTTAILTSSDGDKVTGHTLQNSLIMQITPNGANTRFPMRTITRIGGH